MNAILEKLKQNSQGLLKKEAHYEWAMVLLVTFHVIYMTYFFPREWADTPVALNFVNLVASVIPAIKSVQQYSPLYTNYWGMFYATFWITYPLYMFLGAIGSFYLSPRRYKKLVIESSSGFISLAFLMFLSCTIFFIFFPGLNSIYINQMSNFLPKLILSWFSTVGSGYLLARVGTVIAIRFSINHRK